MYLFKKEKAVLKKQYIIVLLLLFTVSLQRSYGQNITVAKSAVQSYINAWFVNPPEDQEWIIEVNGMKFPARGLEIGLDVLEENLKKGDVSREEKKRIKNHYVQTYIDQSSILANSYTQVLENPEIDVLLQEFLRQAATQLWLEEQMKKDSDAVIPTKEEIDQYYQANSDRLFRLGLSASQIKTYTEQELRQAKLQAWTTSQLAKFKEQNKVTINPKLKKKFGI